MNYTSSHLHANKPGGLGAQELCESRGGRPGLPVPNSRTVSVDVRQHCANPSPVKLYPFHL